MAPRACPHFWIDRVALSAGVSKPIGAQRAAQSVTIGNATTGDLKIYTQLDDDEHYLVLASGYERLITFTGKCQVNELMFWLKAVQSGDVVILWI